MTREASPCQKALVSRPWVKGSASLSTRGPNAASSAGISVKDASTEAATTIMPPRPIDQSTLRRASNSAPKPIITVPPEIRVATPAVPAVVETASSTEAPARSSSRKRLTTSSE